MVLLLYGVIFQAAVGWEYEGKTEKHQSQLGMYNKLTLLKIDHSGQVKQCRYSTKQHRFTNKAWPCPIKVQEFIILI